MVKAPRARRRRLPDVYRVLANLDGRKSLSQAIREAEWEENVLFDEQHVRAITESAALLAEFGYLERQGRPSHGDAG